MGRRRTRDHHLPPGVIQRRGRYYYGRNQIALGDDFAAMLKQYAALRGVAETDTLSEIAADYLCSPAYMKLSAKTKRDYGFQLKPIVRAFGHMKLAEIKPMHVRRYLDERSAKVLGTREKGVLSVVFTWARETGRYDGTNPCVGIKGAGSRSTRYVTDAELTAVLDHCDTVTADFLMLCYLTGQDAGRVLQWTARDVRNGSLWNTRSKTGEKVRIDVSGPLATILDRLTAGAIGARRLILDESGQPMTLNGIRQRFWKARQAAGQAWAIRDLRAKAASDSESLEDANALLAHAQMQTTSIYRRRAAGRSAKPVMRKIKGG